VSTPPALRICVGIATAGRHETVLETLRELEASTRLPDEVVLCAASAADIDETRTGSVHFPVKTLIGPRGLTRQRNRILEAMQPCDVLLFIDDDFLPRNDYLAELEALFQARPDIAAATGDLIADGIHGRGYDVAEARTLLAGSHHGPQASGVAPTYGTYGCNMAFRGGLIAKHQLRFDERLPLYGWQEDIDFSRQFAPFGAIVRCATLRGVHMGSKSGRQSGLRFGYSQVANMVYLHRKGSVSARFAYALMGRNVAANVLKLLRPEPHVDRIGRLRGNILAFFDLLRGRSAPERILEL
jgi:GT2 family glycosyltransferase